MYNISSKKVFVNIDLVVFEFRHYSWDRDNVVKNQGRNTLAATPNQKKSDTPSCPNSGTKNNLDVVLTTTYPVLKTKSLAKVYDQ